MNDLWYCEMPEYEQYVRVKSWSELLTQGKAFNTTLSLRTILVHESFWGTINQSTVHVFRIQFS